MGFCIKATASRRGIGSSDCLRYRKILTQCWSDGSDHKGIFHRIITRLGLRVMIQMLKMCKITLFMLQFPVKGTNSNVITEIVLKVIGNVMA